MAVGVGERTTPAGVERLARQVFAAGLAHTVLAVPIAQERATMHLDTVCTMVDVDAIVMYPNIADHLTAHAVTDGRRRHLLVAEAEPFLVAAAKAMGIDTLRRSTPASTRSPPSASSGTTATTPSPSRPGSPSPTSATSRPTAGWRRPASRSSRSPARSWAPAAAGRAACPARSPATRSERLIVSGLNGPEKQDARPVLTGGTTSVGQYECTASSHRPTTTGYTRFSRVTGW